MRFVVEGPPVGALWKRALLRAVLVPLPVLIPLIALAPSRDHRFNLYWHGGLFRDNPLTIVPHTVDSLPAYLKLGNFRLFGRMLEKALDLAAYALSEVLGLPVNVGFRLVSFVSALLLCVTAVLFAESVIARGKLFRRPPSTVAALIPFAMAAGFVAAGGASPVVLFGGLYLGSAALVLGVAAAVCRIDPERSLRLWWIPLLLLGGAALAAFNEIAYLALPFATMAVFARGRLVLDLRPGRLLTASPARALGLIWLGFLPIFLAVRVVIQRYCAAGNCYKGSDVQFGPETLEALPVRAIAWLPPMMWRAAVAGGSSRPWLAGLVLLAAVLMLGLLAWHAIRDLTRLSPVSGRAAVAVAVAALTLVLLGAAMGSLNVDVQQMVAAGRWGQGWRDSAVTTTAGAMLLAALLHLARTRRSTPPAGTPPQPDRVFDGPSVASLLSSPVPVPTQPSAGAQPDVSVPGPAQRSFAERIRWRGPFRGVAQPVTGNPQPLGLSLPAHPPGLSLPVQTSAGLSSPAPANGASALHSSPPGSYVGRRERGRLSTGGPQWILVASVVILAATATVSAAANKRQRDTTMASPAARLADRVAVEMADFDPSPAGAARRCALRADFLELYAGSPFSVRRFDESLEVTSRQRADVAFCPGVTGR